MHLINRTGRLLSRILALLFVLCASVFAQDPAQRKQIPDKLVVLTFDDSAKSHFTVVRPLLKQYGFNATFFITEGFDFADNKRDYMTWAQIAQLHQEGFEIGNHTRDHLGITDKTVDRLDEQLAAIEQKCRQHNIPRPVTFAWPGNATSNKAFEILSNHGIKFARRGGAPEYPYQDGRGFAYQPGKDHPLLLPSAGDARPDWTLEDLMRAVEQARDGKIAILQFHGAPDTAHSWVNTPQRNFAAFMKYLAINKYQVVALRDLAGFAGTDATPTDPLKIIRERQAKLAELEAS
jgi:peptidoglycan/xylan/chitin deacetylase (PgdA/CDA1 family)